MLQPTNRLTLIDAMRPPAGFRFESAVAVTFTLDLRALLAAPAAFALAGSEGRTVDGGTHEPIELLHAVRSHAGKITVFSQVGEIALPPSRRVFVFLERSIIPVRAPLHGIVHPKVWALRYDAIAEPLAGVLPERRLRVLIASRNLTFDASWDTVVRLDESPAGPGVSLAAVGGLFEALLAIGDGPTADHVDRVGAMVSALSEATFALPAGVAELHLHVLGLARTPSPLPTRAHRSLIISPFLSDDFFTSVHTTRVDELVSRPESLELLKRGSLDRVRSVYAFDDGSAPDLSAVEERLSPEDPGRPMVGLHAKVFAFEEGDRSRVFLGSANATGAAFSSNVEILVELVGSTGALGIDRLCEGSGEEPGLRMLFNTYAGPGVAVDEPGPLNLDGARRKVARVPIEGIVEESGAGWAVTYRSEQAVPAVGDAAIYCWPLASAGNRRRVQPGEPLEVRFETSLEAISGFLAFEIADDLGSVTQFVVPVPLIGVPEHRERFLLRALVGNAERFLRYLLALLDEDAGQPELLEVIDRASSDAATDEAGALNLPVLEKLLRTMRRDPAKLAGLHPLVADLAADDALPPGFAELWTAIYDVAITGAASP